MDSPFHRNLLIIALLASPLLFASVHVAVDHRWDLPPAAFFFTVVVGVVAGSIGVWLMPTGRWTRLAAMLVYAATAVVGMFVWSLLLACGAYGACL